MNELTERFDQQMQLQSSKIKEDFMEKLSYYIEGSLQLDQIYYDETFTFYYCNPDNNERHSAETYKRWMEEYLNSFNKVSRFYRIELNALGFSGFYDSGTNSQECDFQLQMKETIEGKAERYAIESDTLHQYRNGHYYMVVYKPHSDVVLCVYYEENQLEEIHKVKVLLPCVEIINLKTFTIVN